MMALQSHAPHCLSGMCVSAFPVRQHAWEELAARAAEDSFSGQEGTY